MKTSLLRHLVLMVATFALTACGGDTQQSAATQNASPTIQINGAGATFPYPIYSKWFS